VLEALRAIPQPLHADENTYFFRSPIGRPITTHWWPKKSWHPALHAGDPDLLAVEYPPQSEQDVGFALVAPPGSVGEEFGDFLPLRITLCGALKSYVL
jgi:hypothetical protein